MNTLLATRFKNRRLELNLSQAEVAEGICKQGRISMIEKGNYSPGSELLYQLSRKLKVSLDYFFDEKIGETRSDLEEFKELSNRLLQQRDFKSLRYIFELEKEKNKKLTVEDQIYLSWIEVILIFNLENKYEEAIKKAQELLSKINKRDTMYLLVFNTLLNFYMKTDNEIEYLENYKILSKSLERIKINGFEEAEILLKVKYNYCRFLCVNNEVEKAIDEIIETMELCRKYRTISSLGDLYCLLGKVSKDFKGKEEIKKYYQTAVMLYEIEKNEKQRLNVEKYMVENF